MYKIHCDACGVDHDAVVAKNNAYSEALHMPGGWRMVYLRKVDETSDSVVAELHICPKCAPSLGQTALNEFLREAIDLREKPPQEATISISKAHEAVQDLLDNISTPPSPNCSCHISPPCSDCLDYGPAREAIAYLKQLGLAG